MTGRLVTAVAALFLAASCGDPASVDRSPAQPAAAEDQTRNAPEATEPPLVVDPAPAETSSSDEGVTTTVAGPVEPLGGVPVDDPLPPQADSATDPAVADAAVRYTFRHWILVDLDRHLRAQLIENGEANIDATADGFERARGVIELARVVIEDVQFTAPDLAQVSFRLRWGDGPSPYFPNAMLGTAVFQNGTWRISHRTLCLLAFGAGQPCSTPGDRPVPPAAFVVPVPAGFVWAGVSEPAGVVAANGYGAWTDAAGAEVTVSPMVLVGVSAIEPADIAQLLASGRFGAADGQPVEVGGRPGRLSVQNRVATLVVLRPDDVVVVVSVSGATVGEVDLARIVTSMQPTELEITPGSIDTTAVG